MSLLLRRRAMMQLAEDGVEGGGPNDGKVIVFRGPYNVSAQRNRRYVSTDYGHSYAVVDKPRYVYTSSNDVDSEGGYWGNTASFNALLWVSGSDPTATTPTYTGTAYQYTNAVIVSVPDKSGVRKMVRLQNSGSNLSRINRLAIDYISESTACINTPEYPSSQLPLPSYMSSQAVSVAGAFIDGNRANLTKLIITANGGSNVGMVGVVTASISLDGGLSWNNVKDVLQGTQSALPDGQYRDSVWSFDGTKCAIVYNNDLYVSKDGGQSFELRSKAAIDSNVSTIAEIKGTEKLKTLYLLHTKSNNTHSLKKSTDFGQTWETVYDFQSQGVRVLVSADGQHMIYWNNSSTIGYSDDQGSTWITAGGTKPYVTHSNVVGSARMSLDSLNEFDEFPKAYDSGSEINNIATEISFSLANTGSARKLTLYSDTEGQNIAYDFPPTVLYSAMTDPQSNYWWLYSCSVDGLTLDNRNYIIGGGTAKYAITGSCQPYGNVQWSYGHSAAGLTSMASDLYQYWGIRSASHG